jgi:hypothetical protein
MVTWNEHDCGLHEESRWSPLASSAVPAGGAQLESPHAMRLVRLVSSFGAGVRCQYSLWTQLNNLYIWF